VGALLLLDVIQALTELDRPFDVRPLAGSKVVVIADDAIGQLSGTGSLPAETQVLSLAQGVLLRSQFAHARAILDRRTEIEQAHRVLRDVAAEVLYGAPTLFAAEDFSEGAARGPMKLTIEALALEEAAALQHALALAGELLESQEKFEREAVQPSGPGEEPQESDLEEGESREADESGKPRMEEPVDIDALIEHVTTLADELEKAWSIALGDEALSEAQTRLRADFGTLTTVLERQVAETSEALEAVGVSVTLDRFPPDEDDLSSLDFDPDPERRWKQLQVALLLAITDLLEAINALFEPSHTVISFTPQERSRETFWESGAFGLLRRRARFVARVFREFQAARQSLLSSRQDPQPDREAKGDERGQDFFEQPDPRGKGALGGPRVVRQVGVGARRAWTR
jgi:hypothetical protein